MSKDIELPEGGRTSIQAIDRYLGEAIGQGRPIEALVAIKAIGEVMDVRVKEAARAAADGVWSWADVGDALGISKQAAHQKLSERALAIHERLDRREKARHERVSRKFEHARETIKKHPAARDPKLTQTIQQKLDERERARHERLSRRTKEMREKLNRHPRLRREQTD
jgi:hypothetical protein